MPEWTHYRAQIAGLSRDRAPDDPELVEARQNLTEAMLAETILRRAPGLSPAQRERLSRLLVGAA